jgi:3-oxoacyl-[acyl-carrier-protein] synthase-3
MKGGLDEERGAVVPAEIVGLGTAVPPYVLTNADLEQLVDTNDQWITERTGIKERRIAGRDDSTGSLGRQAAERALAVAGVSPADVDLLIVVTASPDHPLPSASCILQLELGMNRCAAMDVIAGCAGFVYGLATAAQFVDSGAVETALVVGAETLSRITDYTDRSTCILFGDGAGAAVLRRGERGVRAFSLGSDGTRSRLLYTPAGGARFPATRNTVAERRHYIVMEGREVFKGAVTAMAASSLEAIRRSGLVPEDIDLVIPHQANQRIIEATARRLKVPMSNVVMNLARYGNTSAASIPIAISEAWEQGQIQPGQQLLLTAFGAGLAWGSLVLDWTLEPPAEPSPEEPTRSALPIVRGLTDGSLWDGMDMQPAAGRDSRTFGEIAGDTN